MPGPSDDEKFSGCLVAIAGLGFLLFMPPLLTLFDREGSVFGVPILWAYLFLAWAAVIGLVAMTVRKSG
jgi:hypothetical protein